MSGNVVVSGNQFVLKATTITVNTESNDVFSSVPVTLNYNGQTLFARSFQYENISESVTLKTVNTSVNVLGGHSTVFARVNALEKRSSIWAGHRSELTTCDDPDPHYQVDINQFRFFPGDKIEGFWLIGHAGWIPLFITPYYVYSFKKQNPRIHYPRYGYNAVEGTFLKSAVDYVDNENNLTTFYVDFMSRKGQGVGILSAVNEPLQHRELFFYGVPEADTHVLSHVFTFTETWFQPLTNSSAIQTNTQTQTGVLLLDWRNRYLISGGRESSSRLDLRLNTLWGQSDSDFRRDFLNANQSFSQKWEVQESTGKWGLDYKQFQNDRALNSSKEFTFLQSSSGQNQRVWFLTNDYPLSQQQRQDAQWQWTGTPKLSTTVGTNLRYWQSATAGQRDSFLHPEFTMKQNISSIIVQSSYDFFSDLDGVTSTADKMLSRVEKQPEIQFIFPQQSLLGLDVVSLGWLGKYNEWQYIGGGSNYVRELNNVGRVVLQNQVKKTVSLSLNIEVFADATFKQSLYSLGDAQYDLTQRYGLGHKVPMFSQVISLEKFNREGNTPFYFDEVRASERTYIRHEARLFEGNWLLFILTNGWNIALKSRDDSQYDMTLGNGQPFSLNSKTSYSYTRSVWNNLLNTWVYRGDAEHTIRASSQHNLQTGQLVAANGQLEWTVGRTWQERVKMAVTLYYDPYRNEMVVPTLQISKDLHCWEVQYQWNKTLEEHRITFRITAFPEFSFGTKSDVTGMGVEFNGLGTE